MPALVPLAAAVSCRDMVLRSGEGGGVEGAHSVGPWLAYDVPREACASMLRIAGGGVLA